MKKILLDTNFIITCIKNKIDLFEEFYFEGYKIVIPKEVIGELKNLGNKTALNYLKKNQFLKISLGLKNVDNGIINYANENPNIIVATLDREIKNKISNRKMIIRNRKKLEII